MKEEPYAHFLISTVSIVLVYVDGSGDIGLSTVHWSIDCCKKIFMLAICEAKYKYQYIENDRKNIIICE